MKNGFFSRYHRSETPVDLDEGMRQLVVADRLPQAPQLTEFAPRRAEYSIEQVASFLHRHIKELDETRADLSAQRDEAKDELAEIERRLAVTQIARDALAETSAKLIEKSAALEESKAIEQQPAETEEVAP